MRHYEVEIAEGALAAVREQVEYIRREAGSPRNAERWLESVWAAVDSLEQFPRRATVAEEDAYLAFEVRQLVVGSHLLLFTIDDARQVVSILALRHGHRRPRPELLDPPRWSSESEEE